MYESFFAFKEKPFSLTPNPRFLFLSKTHNEVYAHLIYGIENRTGFVEVTGEVGTGKTTILRTLLAHLDEGKYRVAFIFNPKLTAFELLRNINREFGVADDGRSNPDLIHSLNEFLLAENRAGRTPILVIDEAQNLSGEVLEQIRLLSNLETEEDKLIQIILVGQPELRNHLSDHSLRQLNQRIAVRYYLRPLSCDETTSYILNRLKIAGRADSNIFSPAALRRVFKCSGGVPRKINLICDRALLTAYSEDRRNVSARDVRQAVAELEGMGEVNAPGSQLPWIKLSVAAFVLLIILAGFFTLDPFGKNTTNADQVKLKPVATVSEEQSTVEQAAAVSEEQSKVAQSTAVPQVQTVAVPAAMVQKRPDSLLASFNALLALWNAPLLDGRSTSDGLDIDSELSTRGFELVRLTGDFEDLRKYNVPVLMPLSEEQGGGYLSVLGQVSPGNYRVAPPYQGQETLGTDRLNALGMSMAMVPWVDFAGIGNVAAPGTSGENVRRLQFLLGLAGCLDVPTNGRYDSRSIKCVKSFQRDHGLIVDGLVGPRTLILIYQVAGAYDMPRLS